MPLHGTAIVVISHAHAHARKRVQPRCSSLQECRSPVLRSASAPCDRSRAPHLFIGKNAGAYSPPGGVDAGLLFSMRPDRREITSLLGFLDEFRFQLHRADAVDLAVDVMIAIDEADVFHFRAHLDDQGGAFHF